MKIKIACVFLWLALLNACNDESINYTCPDPLGSDAITLKDKTFSCYQDSFNNCLWFRLEFSPPELRSVSVSPEKAVAVIFDVGEVECLSQVTAKPTSGWVYSTEAKLHHGYVIRMNDGTYGRLFIDSWKTSGSFVTEVNIIRQYTF